MLFTKLANPFGPDMLGGFSDLARLDAAGTYINFSDATLFNHRTNSLKVWVESSFVQVMGMADIVADHWFLTANCTFF